MNVGVCENQILSINLLAMNVLANIKFGYEFDRILPS